MKKGLNLRVYRRTLDNIALLWNKSALTPEQLIHTEIFRVSEKNERTKLKFATSQDMGGSLMDEGIVAPDDTVLVILNHDLNGLDPYIDYSLEISFDQTYKSKILVYAFGQLPPTERDDKKANVHSYLWNNEEKKWFKMEGVQTEDGFALLVAVAKNRK